MISGYLLDTNALSILAPPSATRAVPASREARLRTWVRAHAEQLFVSTVTVAEIQAGISQLKRKGSLQRATALAHWLAALLEFYDSRMLPLTTPVALEAGRLLDRAIGGGADPGFEDAAIAATAAVHGLTIITANARHFQHFGVPFISLSGEWNEMD